MNQKIIIEYYNLKNLEVNKEGNLSSKNHQFFNGKCQKICVMKAHGWQSKTAPFPLPC